MRAEAVLAEIEERHKSGRIVRFIYRLSGKEARDRESAEAARSSLADARRRMTEQQGRLEREQEAEHRWQDRNLEERIATAYERRERGGWKDDRSPPANER